MTATTDTIPKGYKQTEVGLIPEDWDVKKLGDIGDSIIGLTYSPHDVVGYGTLVYRSSNIQNNKLSYNDNVYVDKVINEKLILKENDILICVRNGSRDLIGKSALIKGKAVGETFGAFMSVFRSDECQPFIFYLILSNLVQRQINQSLGATINQIINKTLNNFQIPYPPKPEEQTAIAATLSDVDALVEKLEKLINKKKDVKQGVMQELLTGKRRLPGFSGEWNLKKLDQVLKVRHGKSQRNVIAINGKYPILATGGEIGRTNEYLYDKPSVLIGRKGTIDIPQYMDTPFWTVDTLFYTEIDNSNDAKFIFYKFQLIDWYSYNEASGVPSLNAKTIERIETHFPPAKPEQAAIANILSDMDNEINKLESQLAKYQNIKQGMMQTLLTGKIRLI